MPKATSKPAATDWVRVKREAVKNAPIAHTPADGPYDPNDAAAVAAYWQQANIKRGQGRLATGQGWQTPVNAAQREVVAHRVTKA